MFVAPVAKYLIKMPHADGRMKDGSWWVVRRRSFGKDVLEIISVRNARHLVLTLEPCPCPRPCIPMSLRA